MKLLDTSKPIKFGDQEYRLSPLTVADLGELQQWVYTKLPDPIAVAKELAKGEPAEIAKELLL